MPLAPRLISLLMLVPCAAQAGEDPASLEAAGARLAAEQCAECHIVREGQPPSFYSVAPSFMSIAARSGMNKRALRVTLRTPHRTMPNIVLDDRQLDALAAYVLSLKP
jgi:mono/diheme cytochrome c family protein